HHGRAAGRYPCRSRTFPAVAGRRRAASRLSRRRRHRKRQARGGRTDPSPCAWRPFLHRDRHGGILAGGYLRQSRCQRRTRGGGMNFRGALAIFNNELMRAFRTAFGSIVSPVLTTSLYFIVFGAAIGGRISEIGGVPYGAFIVPGLLVLTLPSESASNASFGI